MTNLPHLELVTARREVLMITSGIDEYCGGGLQDPYVDEAIQDAQCVGIVVYSIYTPGEGHLGHSYWRIDWGRITSRSFPEKTGGESFSSLGAQAPVSFGPYLNMMNEQFGNQFLLTFLAKPETKAGTESVKIASEIRSVDFLVADDLCVSASSH
jgi:hypothetical protein